MREWICCLRCFMFSDHKAMREIINPLSRNLALAGLILLSLFCDWAVLEPAFTILFVNAGRDHRKLKRAFLTGTLVFGAFNFLGGFGRFSMDINILCTILSMAGPATAGICILRFYNGKRAETHRNFSKWFFLLVLSGTSSDTGTCESAFVCLTKISWIWKDLYLPSKALFPV